MLHGILQAFNLPATTCHIQPLDTGLINRTWKVTTEDRAYILQLINKQVFKHPPAIIENMLRLQTYLTEHYPNYLFAGPISTPDHTYLVQDEEENYYRLLPFIPDSHTITTVRSGQEAFEAARQFGRFTRVLAQFNPQELHYTLPDFHNLALRFQQFEQAYQQASPARLTAAETAIQEAFRHQDLAYTYAAIRKNNQIPLRVTHHDTKITNVLFDNENKGLCVIDLDTTMPGYFISDVGDMMRTYLSPANEEEQDLSRIVIREDYFKAVLAGYFSEMAPALTAAEKELILYAGKYMIYMQALRFLTDFLNGDIYYLTSYPGHNLVRSQNQFTLLNQYLAAEEHFEKILLDFLNTAQ